jgi:hypothetical protein
MNRFAWVTAIGVIGFFLSSCAMFGGGSSRELTLTGSPEFPAVRGNATVSTTDDGNTKIDLEVQHLAPPEQINSDATVFVVWAQDNETNESHNLGAIKVNEDLDGSMTAVTNMRTFDLYVTAEPSPGATTPTGNTILRTNVVMKSVNQQK